MLLKAGMVSQLSVQAPDIEVFDLNQSNSAHHFLSLFKVNTEAKQPVRQGWIHGLALVQSHLEMPCPCFNAQ